MTTPATSALSFEGMVTVIGQAHAELVAQASRAVNSSLTLRNWLIGFHIAEYEQQGTDRAQYGDKLIEQLSDRLVQAGVSRAEARELRRYRQFYLTYPQIRETVSPGLARRLLPPTDAGISSGSSLSGSANRRPRLPCAHNLAHNQRLLMESV